MRWIREHKLISALSAILIAALLILGLSYTVGSSRTGFFNRIYTAIEKPMTALGNAIRDNVSGIFAYKDILAENEALKEENNELRSQVSRLTLNANELQELRDLAEALNYDFIEGDDDIVTASVVSLDGTNWTNAFTIDKGTEEGIAPDCLVICGEGLVGRVTECGTGWSKIVPIIDESSRISFYLQESTKLMGIIEGSENGTLSGFMLDGNADVSEGDVLVTSGMGRYPAGIVIGKISKAGYDSNKQLMLISVRPNVDFTSLKKVSVIL